MLVEILKQANDFRRRCLAAASVAWFRGHECSSYELKSLLHRHVESLLKPINAPISAHERTEFLRDEYQSLYRRFQQTAWPLLKDIERTHWGTIFTMQHYGLPTRLLDWTESFACALYFAHQKRLRDQPAAVWCVSAQSLNQFAVGASGLLALDDADGEANYDMRPWHPRYLSKPKPGKRKPNKQINQVTLLSLAVSSVFTNPRMTSQNAAFTLMGDSFLPLDQQYPQLVSDGLFLKIELGPETYDETEDFLRLSGCSPFTYFPDMDGLAKRHQAEVAQNERDARQIFPHLIKGS